MGTILDIGLSTGQMAYFAPLKYCFICSINCTSGVSEKLKRF